MWALSYLGANAALIAVVALAIIALGALAWFAKNWKLAVAAVVILAAGFSYMQIDKNAYQRRVAEEKAEQVRTLQNRIDTLNKANQADAERAIENATEIARLDALAHDTPANSGDCLDIDATRRVRSIH